VVEEFIYVPVPARWVGEIFARLHELDLEDQSPKLTFVLDADLVTRMYEESHEQHRRLIDFLADNPDRWFYTSELAEALGLEKGARAVGGMLGAFGRRAKNRYGGLTPWETEWDAGRGEAKHRMTEDVARYLRLPVK
jgi:hypothetical protein